MVVILVLTLAVANILKVASRGSLEGFGDKETGKLESMDTAADKSTDDKAAKKTTKGEMVETIKTDAEKLIEAQKEIINGFEKIDPYMKEAEGLIADIDKTAKKIEAFNRETMRDR
jgi:uncharacterized coiled-coil DUF342 family protein